MLNLLAILINISHALDIEAHGIFLTQIIQGISHVSPIGHWKLSQHVVKVVVGIVEIVEIVVVVVAVVVVVVVEHGNHVGGGDPVVVVVVVEVVGIVVVEEDTSLWQV